MKKLTLVLVLITFITSCSIDIADECNPIDILSLVESENEDYQLALLTFQDNTNTANCNELLSLGNKYLNALKAIDACIINGNLEFYNETISKLTTELNNLDCSD